MNSWQIGCQQMKPTEQWIEMSGYLVMKTDRDHWKAKAEQLLALLVECRGELGDWAALASVCFQDRQRLRGRIVYYDAAITTAKHVVPITSANEPSDDDCYPYYGKAPHYPDGIPVPRDQWPGNFVEDPECLGHGVYHKPAKEQEQQG
jgi:hypothetical protein